MGVLGDKAAKSTTRVGDCVLQFAGVKPLDIGRYFNPKHELHMFFEP